MTNNQIAQALKFLLNLGKAYKKFCQDWLQGIGLAGRTLNGANFSVYNLNWQNLRGTDFSNCHLRYSNFESAVGGFSFIRPVILLSAIGLSTTIAFEVPPELSQSYQPLQELGINSQFFGLLSMFFLGFVIYLKMFLTVLYQIKLPPQTVKLEEVRPNSWTTIEEGIKIVLAIIPVWLGTGTYLLVVVAHSLFTKSLEVALALIGVAALFGLAAFATFMWLVGHAFIFKTSFVEADLENARLVEAKFPGCNFYKANLRSADLQKGDYRNCNFKQADLRFADFREANLQGAKFKNARTAGAMGLEEVLNERK